MPDFATTNASEPNVQQFRAFIAVPLPERLRQEIQRAITTLQKDERRNPEFKKLRWTRSENYHLTIAFLGDIPETIVPDLQNNLSVRLEKQTPFSVVITEIKPFPDRRPHVLAAMFSDSPQLVELYRCVTYALHDSGLEVESRKFLPHLTVARKQNRANRLNLQPPVTLDLKLVVEDIILYRSNLSNQGARHDVVFSVPFST